MRKLEKLLSQYAAYHLDHKNIMTHFIGIPLIVFSIITLTARLGWVIGGIEMTLALVLMTISVLYYLSLDRIFGGIMLVVYAAAYPLAYHIAQFDLILWLSLSLGSFIVGWAFQFVGHFYEKKKPAFTDDLIGLVIGPLFVLAEMVFMLGFRKEMEQRVLDAARQQRAAMDGAQISTVVH